MKKTINGKRYDTDKCERLAHRNHYTSSNNYSGTTYLLRASDGALLEWTDTNGQDLYLRDSLYLFNGDIDGYNMMTDEQEARCAELGLIDVVG